MMATITLLVWLLAAAAGVFALVCLCALQSVRRRDRQIIEALREIERKAARDAERAAEAARGRQIRRMLWQGGKR